MLLLTALSFGLFPCLPTGCSLESNCDCEYLIAFTISGGQSLHFLVCKARQLSHYLLTAEKRRDRSIPFLRASVPSKTQTPMSGFELGSASLFPLLITLMFRASPRLETLQYISAS